MFFKGVVAGAPASFKNFYIAAPLCEKRMESAAALPPPPPPRIRPLGVTILAILEFVGGVLALLLGLFFMAVGPYVAELFAGTAVPPLLSALLGVLGVVFLVAGLVALLVGWGLWTGKGWAWWIVVVLEVLGVVSSLAGLAMGDPSSLLGLLIAALILYYFFKPHVKDFFGVRIGFST